jgi:hypothetical protein
MNYSDIENSLARFKLKDAPANARASILAAARVAWNETPRSVRAESVWRWPIYCAAAAALLLLSNSIVTSLDQRWTAELIAEKPPALNDTPTATEQLYVELGLDPAAVRRLRTLVARPMPKGDINKFLRQKNQSLQGMELL